MTNSPAKLGPYQLADEIGRGGGGVVHRATHERTGEIVALKRLRTADPAAAGAIRREIAALARIRHPGVVRILEHGTEDGPPWPATGPGPGPARPGPPRGTAARRIAHWPRSSPTRVSLATSAHGVSRARPGEKATQGTIAMAARGQWNGE